MTVDEDLFSYYDLKPLCQPIARAIKKKFTAFPGKIIANLFVNRRNITLLEVIDIDPKIIKKKLSSILNNPFAGDVIVNNSLDSSLSKFSNVDVVFIATSSDFRKVSGLIKTSLVHKCNVVSICEELFFGSIKHGKLCAEIDVLARQVQRSVIGTGINPGYVMDVLPTVLTAACQKVDSVKVTRYMNSGSRRVSFQKKIGTGLTIAEFGKKTSNNEITGHVGLCESIYFILNELGWEADEVKEMPPEPVICQKDMITSYGEKVSKGDVCGLKSKAFAKVNGRVRVMLDFTAFSGDHEEYDAVEIKGTPDIYQKISGGIHGDLGTSAMVANLIPKIVMARPGLLTMKDVLPCYTENIMKRKRNNDDVDDMEPLNKKVKR